MPRTVLVIAAMALALSACEVRAEIAVNDDGSGTFGMVFAMDPAMLALIGESGLGNDPFEDLRRDLADDPVVWDVDEFTEGTLTGIRATFRFASIDDLLDKTEAMKSPEVNDSVLEDFSIAREGGAWMFEGRALDPQEEISNSDFPIPGEQLATFLRFQFRLTLPGRAADHNADEVKGGDGRTTFVWTPPLDKAAPDFRASTVPGGSGSPIVPLALALAVLAVIAIAWLRAARRPPVTPPDAPAEGQALGETAEDASLPG
ncbi:MAG TPA: hypothetical protein VJ922_03550 [Actinomycetota bacterium]|nr:hypothetical protein [Actinomycetota bacterium]